MGSKALNTKMAENVSAFGLVKNLHFDLTEIQQVRSRATIDGTANAYRTDLAKLVGRSVVVTDVENEDLQLSIGANFKKNDFSKEHNILENGTLVEQKITRSNAHELSFIVGKITMDFKQMNEYIVSELYNLLIDESTDVDMDKLKKAYLPIGQANANTYLIMGATVVEVIRKTFREKDVKADAKIPVASLGGVLGYAGKVYSQESSYTRMWRIYLDLAEVNNILKAY